MNYWKLFYHITFAVKKRLPLIVGDVEPRFHHAIEAKACELGATVYAVGGIEDHVHLAVAVPPSISLSNFIGQVKGNSSHFMNHVLCPSYNFEWQDGFGVVSFGPKQLQYVIDYIRNQRRHHQTNSTHIGLEPFDENETGNHKIAENSASYGWAYSDFDDPLTWSDVPEC